ncbi:hypothetical protein NDU88_011550 [Pleurodeles waltl]|uniref:Uncharacterized protein n=1 Tax=Pleurodeles waltl TaxID=8319 RepID=A0AAV7QXK7_PLEWA|nr:hypothetical protein NDU88_011550 [Pleurodeles waltl]
MGAATDAWDSDFRVPGTEKEDGHRREAQELPSRSDARKGDRKREDVKKTTTGEDETGNPKLPRTWTASEELARQQETSTFRHAPGGTWLNKILMPASSVAFEE